MEQENEKDKSIDNEPGIFDEIKPPPLPVYYSETAIYVFTIIFGAFFGSVMMAINLHNARNRKAVYEVVFFGILFGIGANVVLTALGGNSWWLPFVSSFVAILILKFLFWEKYIGKGTAYKNKPIWIPLIIGVVIIGAYTLFYLHVK